MGAAESTKKQKKQSHKKETKARLKKTLETMEASLQQQLNTLEKDLQLSQANSTLTERHFLEENKALKEQLDDARRDLNLNREASSQQQLTALEKALQLSQANSTRTEKSLLEENKALKEQLDDARRNFNLKREASSQQQLTALEKALQLSQANSALTEKSLLEEIKALKEQLDDARRNLNLNKEALTKTVLQCNNKVTNINAELAIATNRLETERQRRKTLEAETDSTRSQLVEAIKKAERCLAARKATEKALHSEKVKHQHFIDKLTDEATSQRETISSLSQKLAAAETRANSMENKVQEVTQQLTEKDILLEVLQKEKEQAAVVVKELETALQSRRELISHAKIYRDQLKSLSHSNEQLEQSKRQLEEEVRDLRYRMEKEQYRCDAEERAHKNIQRKLEQVNILQQSQEANDANARFLLEHKIFEMERKLGEARTTQQDILNQRDSTHTELERYHQLYADEMRLRKSLAVKLERTESQLSNAKLELLRERNRSLITSNTANSSRVEDHLATMQSELDRNISRYLNNARAELDPVRRGTDRLEALKRKYMI